MQVQLLQAACGFPLSASRGGVLRDAGGGDTYSACKLEHAPTTIPKPDRRAEAIRSGLVVGTAWGDEPAPRT